MKCYYNLYLFSILIFLNEITPAVTQSSVLPLNEIKYHFTFSLNNLSVSQGNCRNEMGCGRQFTLRRFFLMPLILNVTTPSVCGSAVLSALKT